jgi:hypothetical protein
MDKSPIPEVGANAALGQRAIIRKSSERIAVKRTSLLGLLGCLACLYFFVLGNYQGFLDQTLRGLLTATSWFGFSTAMISCVGAIVLFAGKRSESRRRRALGFLGYALNALVSAGLALLALAFQSLFKA